MKIKKNNITGLLISAGLSGRMGAFKPLLPYNQTSFVVVVTQKMLNVCERVIVVTGFNNKEVEATIKFAFLDGNLFPRVDLVYNPVFEKGMFSSIQTGLKSIENSDWILYHFVDQPFHEKNFYTELTAQLDDKYDWIQPAYKGKEGHPVIFNKKVADFILDSPTDSVLRSIRDLPEINKNYWNCNFPKILKDYDTPEDLKK